jgi:hypothetical protein
MRIGPTCSLTGTWSLTAPAGPSGTVSVVAQTNCNYYLQASGGTYTAGQTCYFGSTVGSSINLSAEL